MIKFMREGSVKVSAMVLASVLVSTGKASANAGNAGATDFSTISNSFALTASLIFFIVHHYFCPSLSI